MKNIIIITRNDTDGILDTLLLRSQDYILNQEYEKKKNGGTLQ